MATDLWINISLPTSGKYVYDQDGNYMKTQDDSLIEPQESSSDSVWTDIS